MACLVENGWRTRWLAVSTVFLLMAEPARGEMAPAYVKEPSYEIGEQARMLVGPIEPRALGDDATFVRVLGEALERPYFTLIDRVDALSLMLRKIGWFFDGTCRLPPGFSYPQTFQGQATTYLQYQQQLAFLAIDGKPLLALARSECPDDPARCSSAILLAGLVDRDATRAELTSMLDEHWINSTRVPPITLHALALAVVLSRDPATAIALSRLVGEVKGEEETEDLLSADAMYDGEAPLMRLEDFARDAVRRKYDQSLETAVILLHHRQKPAQFISFYDRLVAEAGTPEVRRSLDALRDADFVSEFARSGRGSWMKVWDDFSIAMYEDGVSVVYGAAFRDFVPHTPHATAEPEICRESRADSC